MRNYNRLPKPDNRIYLGVGGSGKSFLALHHSYAFERVLICDPTGQDEFEEYALVTDDPAELVELFSGEGAIRACWRGTTTMGKAEGFDWCNRVAKAAGNMLIVWDEADLFMSPSHMPETAYWLWNMGRHRGLSVFATSRRPARLARDCTANLSRAAVFATQEPGDIKYLKEFMGTSVAQVPGLPRFSAVDWTPEAASVKKSPYP